MRFLGMIAAASLAFNLVSTQANAWAVVSGTAHWLAVEPNAERHVWKVGAQQGNLNQSGQIWERTNPATNTWVRRDNAVTNAWQIALPNDPPGSNLNIPYILKGDLTMAYWVPAQQAFVAVNGGAAYGIAVQNTNNTVAGLALWAIGTDYNLYLYMGGGWAGPWYPWGGGALGQIAVDGAGTLWMTNRFDGRVARNTPNGIIEITASGPTHAYSLSGAAIINSSNQQFYFVTPGTADVTNWGVARAPMPGTQPQMFGRAGNVLWALGDANEMYRCTYNVNCF